MIRLSTLAVLPLLLGAALLLPACASTEGAAPGPEALGEEEELPPPEDIVSGVGTIRYVDLEGGFYGLVAADSTRYSPQNLEAEYREDGLRVRFRGVKQEDEMTTQMWGMPLEILAIQPLNNQ